MTCTSRLPQINQSHQGAEYQCQCQWPIEKAGYGTHCQRIHFQRLQQIQLTVNVLQLLGGASAKILPAGQLGNLLQGAYVYVFGWVNTPGAASALDDYLLGAKGNGVNNNAQLGGFLCRLFG